MRLSPRGSPEALTVQPRGPPSVTERTPGQSAWVMPRRETTAAGNQGQGPGHNGAIVGLQSVDFQAAVPHPPSPPPFPPPCQEVTQTPLPPFGPPPEGSSIPDPKFRPARPGAGSRVGACYVHQVATEHCTSEGGRRGPGAGAQSPIRASGHSSTSCFIQNQVALCFPSTLL